MAERDKRLDRSEPRKVVHADPNPKFRTIERSPLAQDISLPAAKLPADEQPKNPLDALERMLAAGLKPRPYDETDEVIAPNNIGPTAQVYDAKAIWDNWILQPSCDALISFKGPPAQNTPVTFAGTKYTVPRRAQKVYYVAGATGVTGTLSVWVARWK